MRNTADTSNGATRTRHLSHDRPCYSCGHAMHSYLPCSDSCTCTPQLAPGLPAARPGLVTA
ncbi:hypothetical protein [Nocardioides sp. InS609-2]|uniref:hypothetical protein n=1 Tax=Nocardioides sp. InS609-2 TaxID=2760705 RepID=UPI0020BE98EB|nr:hypothetical protein [Nocardioides sp. InS609-2]